jgi:hypothetical protein
MSFNIRIGFYMFFCSLVFCSCISIKKKFGLSDKIDITEKQENCVGYHSWVSYNEYKECIYVEVKCLEGDRGSYCSYSKCSDKEQIDTILYIEFRTNNGFEYKKEYYDGNFQKKNYAYIADGRCIFKEWHIKRHFPHPYLTIFIEGEDFLGDRTYWDFAREEGSYKEGQRVGLWTFTHFTNCRSTEKREPAFVRETSNYKNGKREGITMCFNKQNTQGNPPPDTWTDTLRITPYKDGAINGWVKEWTKNGLFIDSTYYENDKIVK